MNKNNNLLLTVIAVATLIVAVIGASFAYFASQIDEGEGAAFTANTAPMSSAFVAVGKDFQMTVTADKMQSATANATNVAATSTDGEIKVEYASSVQGTPMFCTYELWWDWTGTSYLAHSPIQKDGTEKYSGKEFTIQASFASDPAVAAGQNALTENKIADEKDWTEVVPSDEPVKLGSATIWSNQTSKTYHTWTYVSKFYNVPAYQNALAGLTFAGKFYIDKVQC